MFIGVLNKSKNKQIKNKQKIIHNILQRGQNQTESDPKESPSLVSVGKAETHLGGKCGCTCKTRQQCSFLQGRITHEKKRKEIKLKCSREL